MARAPVVSEKLTDANLEKVINLLASEKPITKKAACEMLGIAYNTTRLTSLIEKHQEAQKFEEAQRAKKRYKAPTQDEVSYVVKEYLAGESMATIAKRLYRSDNFVSNTIERTGCPKREIGHSYFNPSMLPDSCVKEEFREGELVFSAKYDSLAVIHAKVSTPQGTAYRVYLEDEKWQQYAYQPWWELGSLEHLEPYGI